MLKRILSNKLTLGGIIVCVIIASSILLWTQQPKEKPEVDATDISKIDEVIEIDNTEPNSIQNIDASEKKGQSTSEISEAQKTDMIRTNEQPDNDSWSEEELRQKSLLELIAIIDEIPSKFIRASWFTEIARKEVNNLDPNSEEKLKLDAAMMRAYPEMVKQYEEETGRPHPPPGYSYIAPDSNSPPVLVKFNTPVVRMVTSEQTGYGNWDQLSEVEWERYKVLDAIAKQLLWPKHSVSREMSELAAEWKNPLYEKSWGTRTIETPSLIVSYNRPRTEEDEIYEKKLMKEARSTTPSTNLPNVSHLIDHKLVIKVMNELKEALDIK